MGQARFMLAACASGSGKTMITCGILKALKNRGLLVSAFKCGPDYIDPMFHTRVLHTKSRNLDTFFADEKMVRYLFAKNSKESDISVMEGVMGYYDGLGLSDSRGSAANLAEVTDTPVLLIVNGKGMSRSILAQIKGFLSYQEPSRIQGVILNQISPMMYQELAGRIEEELKVHVYGYVPRLPELVIESRHLGLVMPKEVEGLEEKLGKLAKVLEETLDLDGILSLAGTASVILEEKPEALLKAIEQADAIREDRPVIAVARDEAFCFIYEDNLKLLEELGSSLRFFSPLHDGKLPEGTTGLLLYGGYPELYAKELSQNTSMLQSIKASLEGGLPCMAECGGFMYLHEVMEDIQGTAFPMVGSIKGRAYKTGKLTRFGYITLTPEGEGILGAGKESLKGHEFHYFDSTSCGDGFEAKKPIRKSTWKCIHSSKNTLLGFPHLYYHSNPFLAADFLKECVEFGGKER